MIVARSIDEMRRLREAMQGRVALVPTMGALHEGHLSLMRKARSLADCLIVSIYVNPLQFGPNEDFARYPRTPEEDLAACRKTGVDCVWMPETLYPDGDPLVRVHPDPSLAGVLCGRFRPGHFEGVLTVVAILLHITAPQVAVFGEKDWQQLVLIRRMVRDLRFPVEVVGAPTVREPDGLAMSSRNRYLSPEERRQARAIPDALFAMRKAVAEGERDVDKLLARAKRMLAEAGITPEYLEVREGESLALLSEVRPGARAFVAARVGGARLIDNLALLEA